MEQCSADSVYIFVINMMLGVGVVVALHVYS